MVFERIYGIYVREDEREFLQQLKRRVRDDDEVSEVSQYGDGQSSSSTDWTAKALQSAIDQKETAELERDTLNSDLGNVVRLFNEEGDHRKEAEQKVQALKEELKAARQENASQAEISKLKIMLERVFRIMFDEGLSLDRETLAIYQWEQNETQTEGANARIWEDVRRAMREVSLFVAQVDET